MITAILLITVLYVLPLIGCYNWIHKAHSKGGVYEGADPDGIDFWFTILPAINIFLVFALWTDAPIEGQQPKKVEFTRKFFGLKK